MAPSVGAPELPLPNGLQVSGRMNGRDWRVEFDPNTPRGDAPWVWKVRNMREGGVFAEGREWSRNSAVNAAHEQTSFDFKRDDAVRALYR